MIAHHINICADSLPELVTKLNLTLGPIFIERARDALLRLAQADPRFEGAVAELLAACGARSVLEVPTERLLELAETADVMAEAVNAARN